MATLISLRMMALAAVLAVAAPVAHAQDQAKAPANDAAAATSDGGSAAASNPVDLPWNKMCGEDPRTKKKICQTGRALLTDNGQFVASVMLREVDGETRKVLLVQTPVGMQIQPGVRIQVDQGNPVPGKYTICFTNVCIAEIPMTDDFIEGMKKGKDLLIIAITQMGKAQNFPLSLNGFTAAYTGPAIDTAALQRQREELAAEVQKKAKEAQQKLIDAQKAASDAANPSK